MAINLTAAFEQPPPKLDYLWPGLLSGTVGALVAPGATGKSFWALEAAMAVASAGIDGGDLLQLKPEHGGRVTYLAGEDPEAILITRIHEIGKHLNQRAREAIAHNLVIEPTMGKRVDITHEGQLAHIIEQCVDTRLIIIDTLSRVHGWDENSNGEMGRLLGILEYLAERTKAAVLFLHHVSKVSFREGQADQQHSARGASVLVDNARWVGYVAKMTAEEAKKFGVAEEKRGYYVRHGGAKLNYALGAQEQWYRRHEGGVLLPDELTDTGTRKAMKAELRRTVDEGDDDEWFR